MNRRGFLLACPVLATCLPGCGSRPVVARVGVTVGMPSGEVLIILTGRFLKGHSDLVRAIGVTSIASRRALKVAVELCDGTAKECEVDLSGERFRALIRNDLVTAKVFVREDAPDDTPASSEAPEAKHVSTARVPLRKW